MTIRYLPVIIMFSLIFLVACGGNQPAEEPEQSSGPDTSDIPINMNDEEPEVDSADSTIINTVNEIVALEHQWEEEGGTEELKQDLVIYHRMYVNSIVNARSTEPDVLNRVLFSQYSRILQLEPGNEEAEAGLNGVRAWYETHAMTVPSQVNPIDFLPEHTPKVNEPENEPESD